MIAASPVSDSRAVRPGREWRPFDGFKHVINSQGHVGHSRWTLPAQHSPDYISSCLSEIEMQQVVSGSRLTVSTSITAPGSAAASDPKSALVTFADMLRNPCSSVEACIDRVRGILGASQCCVVVVAVKP